MLGGVWASPGAALLWKAQSTPQTRLALNLAVSQSNFVLSEETDKCVLSLWNILSMVLIPSLYETADNIPLYFSLEALKLKSDICPHSLDAQKHSRFIQPIPRTTGLNLPMSH